MTDKQLLKDLAKEKPVAAIQALIEAFSEHGEENKKAHESIIASMQTISDKIYSKKGNGNCIVDQIEQGQRQFERIETRLEEMGKQPKDEIGEPIERRTEPSKKEKFKDLPIDRKVKTIVLCLTLVSLIGLLGASFLGFGEDIINSFVNRFITN